MTSLAQRRQDTLDFLTEHGETLTLKRRLTTYDDEGNPTTTWTTVATFSGDWQPRSGDLYADEAGLRVESDAQIVASYDLSVKADDRVYKADGSFEKVNHILKEGGHIMIRLTSIEEGS